jgi:hypothetical protein
MLSSQATTLETPARERTGLVWAQVGKMTIAKISGELPASHEWRRFLDQLRPSSRPLVLWIRGRIWLGSAARTELATAIGSSKVALLVDDDIGRGLATALRWLGSDVHAYGLGELDDVERVLGLPPGAGVAIVEKLV